MKSDLLDSWYLTCGMGCITIDGSTDDIHEAKALLRWLEDAISMMETRRKPKRWERIKLAMKFLISDKTARGIHG